MRQNELYNQLKKDIDNISYRHNRYEVLSDFFAMCAIAISNKFDLPMYEKREKKYMQIAKRYNKQELEAIASAFAHMFTLLTHMIDDGFDDWLGRLYMDSATSNSQTGQFFTPYDVSKACAQLTIKDRPSGNKNGIITLYEPTCGSGGMVLAGVEQLQSLGVNYANDLLVTCGDIDERCVHMAYLQLSLAGVPAIIMHQNALSLETWDEWHTPALCMNWMRFRSACTNAKEEAKKQEEEKEKVAVEVVGSVVKTAEKVEEMKKASEVPVYKEAETADQIQGQLTFF